MMKELNLEKKSMKKMDSRELNMLDNYFGDRPTSKSMCEYFTNGFCLKFKKEPHITENKAKEAEEPISFISDFKLNTRRPIYLDEKEKLKLLRFDSFSDHETNNNKNVLSDASSIGESTIKQAILDLSQRLSQISSCSSIYF